MAMKSGNTKIVKALIDAGADVNGTAGPLNVTPLMLMVSRYNNSMNAFNVLINNGADVNARDNNDDTALKKAIQYAEQTGDLNSLKMLLTIPNIKIVGGPHKGTVNYVRNRRFQAEKNGDRKKVDIMDSIINMLRNRFLVRKPHVKQSYEILGVSPSASLEEIEKAFRALSKIWHPDKHRDKSKEEQQKILETFQPISNAYNTLKFRASKK